MLSSPMVISCLYMSRHYPGHLGKYYGVMHIKSIAHTINISFYFCMLFPQFQKHLLKFWNSKLRWCNIPELDFKVKKSSIFYYTHYETLTPDVFELGSQTWSCKAQHILHHQIQHFKGMDIRYSKQQLPPARSPYFWESLTHSCLWARGLAKW